MREDTRGPGDLIEIVERLALAHEDGARRAAIALDVVTEVKLDGCTPGIGYDI